MITLRDYQKDAVYEGLESLSKKMSCLIVAPTGSGKTEIMMEILKNLLPANILVITKRVNLVDQTRNRFKEYGLSSTVYCSSLGEKKISNITIASVDSIHAVINEANFKYLVFDEVHNLSEDPDSRFNKVVSHLAQIGSKLIGFTATPYRAASGTIYGERKFFDKIDYQIEFEDLINEGYLVRPVLKNAVNEFDTSKLKTFMGDYNEAEVSKLVEDTVFNRTQVDEALDKTSSRKKVFWQCANIAHAISIANLIEEKTKTRVAIVHSKEKNDDLKAFENDPNIKHCVFVTILSEGYNYPPADALVLMRPTKSPVLYVQTVGRILRPSEGKKDALVLDFGQVIRNCGPINRPILSRDVREKSAEEVDKEKLWLCKSCLSYNNQVDKDCVDCGAPRTTEKKEIKLTSKHEEEAEIIFAKTIAPQRKRVKSAVVSNYTAKSGNECYRIIYNFETINFFETNAVTEYFPKNYGWSLLKARDRFYSLGLNIDNFDKVKENKLAPIVPSEVEFVYEGQYAKIKKVIFREGYRE